METAARVTFNQHRGGGGDGGSDDDDDDVLVTSGPHNHESEGEDHVIGLFDVVKREFRCPTASIRNRSVYDEPTSDEDDDDGIARRTRSESDGASDVRRHRQGSKLSYVQEMKRKVSMSLELKSKGCEELEGGKYRQAIKYFHQSLLYLKGLDPDEGVALRGEDVIRLRHMPVKLKEIKESTEVDNYLNLAVCLMHKPSPPYARIKEYSLRILAIDDSHVKALMRAGMACYHLGEFDLSKCYLQAAKRHSASASLQEGAAAGAIGRIHCRKCQKLFVPLLASTSPTSSQ